MPHPTASGPRQAYVKADSLSLGLFIPSTVSTWRALIKTISPLYRFRRNGRSYSVLHKSTTLPTFSLTLAPPTASTTSLGTGPQAETRPAYGRIPTTSGSTTPRIRPFPLPTQMAKPPSPLTCQRTSSMKILPAPKATDPSTATASQALPLGPSFMLASAPSMTLPLSRKRA